jgi:hypothetical protein
MKTGNESRSIRNRILFFFQPFSFFFPENTEKGPKMGQGSSGPGPGPET